MASRNLSDLSPQMQVLAENFKAQCLAESLDIVIICTYRPDSEQQKAFESGASKCRPGQSAHNCHDEKGKPAAEAFDVGVIRNGKYVGNGRDPDYLRAGEIGEKLGLAWAGRWKSFKETAHFQNSKWRKP